MPLEISVTDGELAEVTVVDGDGAEVPGSLARVGGEPATPQVWTPEAPLAYGTSYTLTATATNADDEEADGDRRRSPRSPRPTLSTPSIGPLDGMVVGVGMPIRVYFDDPVADKAAVESHLLVTSSNPTDGVVELVQRHRGALPPVAVLAGEHRGDPGRQPLRRRLRRRRLGREEPHGVLLHRRRSTSPSPTPRTHTMQVYDGDQLVQTFPISAGSPDNPSYNGAHVVTELNRDRVMDSSTYGVPVDSPEGYRTPVEYAVRISDSGEFVHAAPWSVAQQGNTNVSHGCINMSTERAAWFFNFSQPGDVVEIQQLQRRRLCASATSTTGPSRGTSGRPAAR